MKPTGDRRTYQAEFWFTLLIAGSVFFLVRYPDLIWIILPPFPVNVLRQRDILFTSLLIITGLVGFFAFRIETFFQRWNRNKSPIVFDVLILGVGIGGLTALAWNLCVDRFALSFSSAFAIILVLLAFSHWSKFAGQGILSRKSEDKKNSSLTDDPLPELNAATDAFGRLDFGSSLAKAITASDPSNCHVFGLVGAWGSGKTTILEAVAKDLDSPFHVVTIDSWAFRDTGRLTEAILTSIVQELDKHYLIPNLKRSLCRYLSILSPATKSVPWLESVKKVLASSEEVENLKSHIAEAIDASGGRFLVIIDDVDRLDSSELQDLLKTVRLCASIPRIVYVLAYDRISVYKLISDDPGRARDFMDKVIEDEWVLPLITSDCLRAYLLGHLPSIAPEREGRFSRDFEERLKKCFPSIRQVLQTPRQIKRAGIALSRRSGLLSRLNPFDAFVWELIRQREPMLYEYVAQYPWLVRPEPGVEVEWLVRKLVDKDQGKSGIDSIKKLIKENSQASESISELFWELFPQGERTSEKVEADEIRLRRICNTRYFNAYFLLARGEGLAESEEMDALLGKINGAVSEDDVRTVVSKALGIALKEKKISDLISLMGIYFEDLQPRSTRSAINAIREFHDQQCDPKSKDSMDLVRSLTVLNVQLINKLPDDTTATAVANDLLTKTSTLVVAGFYAASFGKWGHPRRLGERALDSSRLSRFFDQRLEKELLNLNEDIFKAPLSQLFVLLDSYSDKTKLWDFVKRTAGSSPSHWAKIMINYVLFFDHGSEIETDSIRKVPVDVLKQAFDTLKSADDSQFSKHERQATRTFVEWFSQSQASAEAPIVTAALLQSVPLEPPAIPA